MNKDNCFYSNLTDKAEVLWLHAFYSSLDVKTVEENLNFIVVG